MKLSCIIVDDEPLALKLLETYIKKTSGLELIASFSDSIEAINAIKSVVPNLLFLDIQMPDLNGMELAHMIPHNTRVVFTTAFKEYAFDSYEVNAMDFLLKPIKYSKFLITVERAMEWFGKTHATENNNEGNLSKGIYIKVDGALRHVLIEDIIYISGMKDYVMFYVENERKPLITYLRMKSIENILPKEKFMRVHRSYIVALNKIEKVDRNNCIYIGKEIIHVTEAFSDQFHRFLQKHGLVVNDS